MVRPFLFLHNAVRINLGPSSLLSGTHLGQPMWLGNFGEINMYRKLPRTFSPSNFAFGMFLILATHFCAAQFEPASPPIANPSDQRFVGISEDFTTPTLSTSTLKAAPELIGYVNDNGTYTVQLSQVQWRWGDPLDLYVLKPKGIKNPPVILYLYSYPYDTDYFKSEAWQRAVTKDGFAAVGFVTALTGHRYHDRPMREWFISELQESLAVSAHDVQMVLNYLAARGDVDMNRVGLFAEGSGAAIAILASAVDPRIKVLDVAAPWGDWPIWLGTSPFVPQQERADYLKPEFLKKVGSLDPVDWLPKVQAQKVRLQDMVFDRTTPKEAKEALRAAAPANSVIVDYKTPADFNLARNHNRVMGWIHTELQGLAEPRTATTENACCQPQLPSGTDRDRR